MTTVRLVKLFRCFIGSLLLLNLTGCATHYADRPEVQQFINQVSVRDNFNRAQLVTLFSHLKPVRSTLTSIAKPHEAMPWYTYRPIFLQAARAQAGADFWRQHAATLTYAQQHYGVPPEIIVAILGVETRYGQLEGNYSAFAALTTLAFDYSARAPYFKSELEQYLLLTRDAALDPLTLKSSYAGALGAAQFMPSSYRQFARSYQSQAYPNLFTNDDDAIISIANYFDKKGWRADAPITVRAHTMGQRYLQLPKQGLKPTLTLTQMAHYGIYAARPLPATELATLITLEDKQGLEHWLGLHNFYVITRYNSSPLYAMAVYQLSEWIRRDYIAGQKLSDATPA